MLGHERDMEVIAEAADGPAALAAHAAHRPDVTLLDLRLPGIGGAALIAAIRAQDPAARFIILGEFNDSKASKPLQYLTRRGETEIASVLPASDSHGEVWTEFYAREETYTALDHVLVSPALRSAVHDGRVKIFDAPETKEASDHRPLVMTLEFFGDKK